jgi:methionyl aminopeptidase
MIHLRSVQEVEKIRESCRIVADCLRHASQLVRPGVTTSELDREIDAFIKNRGGKAAFKGYRGYPASACLSVDDVVVHGIPSADIVLEEGMTIGVDVGVVKNGYYGDSAVTLPVGQISDDKKRLLEITRQSLYQGIQQARVGNRIHDISAAVQAHVEKHGFAVVRDLVGHGIGRELHEEPQVPNFGKPGTGPRLKPGMVFCIEPMVNMGTFEVMTKEDHWTIVTADGKPSAHFEHTVHVTEEGPEILTITDLF